MGLGADGDAGLCTGAPAAGADVAGGVDTDVDVHVGHNTEVDAGSHANPDVGTDVGIVVDTGAVPSEDDSIAGRSRAPRGPHHPGTGRYCRESQLQVEAVLVAADIFGTVPDLDCY